MSILYKLKRKNPKLIIQCYGDANQCPPRDIRYYEYKIHRAFAFLVGSNVMNKKFVEGVCRQKDVKLLNMLNHLIEHKRLLESVEDENGQLVILTDKRIMPKCSINLTHTNKTRCDII
jgi:hypothetical protein